MLECEPVRYDSEAEILVGNIINVSANNSILDEKGSVNADKANRRPFDDLNGYAQIKNTLSPLGIAL